MAIKISLHPGTLRGMAALLASIGIIGLAGCKKEVTSAEAGQPPAPKEPETKRAPETKKKPETPKEPDTGKKGAIP